jgi:hypothetical protein
MIGRREIFPAAVFMVQRVFVSRPMKTSQAERHAVFFTFNPTDTKGTMRAFYMPGFSSWC